jgi:hypothetical protein
MTPPAQQSKQNMKTNVGVQKQPVEAKTQPPDIQRRIDAGWLKLWRAVYPKRPPPREVQSLESKVQSPGPGVQGPKSKVQRPTDQIPAAARRDLGWVTPPVTAATRFVDLYGVK